jgi:hypothetical protein
MMMLAESGLNAPGWLPVQPLGSRTEMLLSTLCTLGGYLQVSPVYSVVYVACG